MAGTNPGMVIKVAADIAEMQAAFATISRVAGEMAGDVVEAQDEIQTKTKESESAVIAFGTAIGNMASDAIGFLTNLAWKGIKELGEELFDVIDEVIDLTAVWGGFKDELALSLEKSGALQAGFDALGDSLVRAFGGTREDAVRTIADLIEQGALHTLDFVEALITLGEYGARGIAALIVPIDAVLLTLGELAQKYTAFVLYLLETAAQLPVVGGKYKELADEVRGLEGGFASWRDEQRRNIDTHAEMVAGQGALFEWTGKAKGAIDESRDAILKQRDAAAEAATSVDDLATGWSDYVMGNGATVLALADTNDELARMDEWSRNIKNKDPFGVLLDGMSKALPALATTGTVAEDTAIALDNVGTEAIDMSDDVRFAAEVVQKAALTWSDAMELVRQGQGTMTGTIGKATKPAGMSQTEWNLMQTRPGEWESRFGYGWQQPGMGGAFNLLDQFGGGGGSTVNNSVTVNTVAGDKNAIASVVSDALATSWRQQGMKG